MRSKIVGAVGSKIVGAVGSKLVLVGACSVGAVETNRLIIGVTKL